jgi:hypothetical protein
LIPIVIEYETAQPVRLTFDRGINQVTGLRLYLLRSGLFDVPDDMAARMLELLRGRPAGIAPLPGG